MCAVVSGRRELKSGRKERGGGRKEEEPHPSLLFGYGL